MIELSQELQLLRNTIREFAKNEIESVSSYIDSEGTIPEDVTKKLLSLGLYGVTLSNDMGGANSDFLTLVILSEELSRASGSIGATISLHNAVVCEALKISPRVDEKHDLIARLASGTLGAMSLEDSGVTFKLQGKDLLIDGTSDFVINAARGGIFLVLATPQTKGKDTTTSSALLAFSSEDAGKSFKVSEPRKLLGMRGAGIASISFNQTILPQSSLVTEFHDTKDILQKLKRKARLAVAAQALGIAQASIDSEVAYANQRTQFNSKIGRFYAVQDFIARDQIGLETSRKMTYSAAACLDDPFHSATIDRETAIAKISATDCAVSAARHSIRIHGGYGFVRDYPVERYARDARLTQLYAEPNESLKRIIATSLLGYQS